MNVEKSWNIYNTAASEVDDEIECIDINKNLENQAKVSDEVSKNTNYQGDGSGKKSKKRVLTKNELRRVLSNYYEHLPCDKNPCKATELHLRQECQKKDEAIAELMSNFMRIHEFALELSQYIKINCSGTEIYHRVVDWEKKSTMYLEIAAKLQNLTITPENQNSNLRETHEKSPIQIISQSSIGPRDYYALKLLAYLSDSRPLDEFIANMNPKCRKSIMDVATQTTESRGLSAANVSNLKRKLSMPTNVNHAKCHNEKNDVITLSDDEECSNASKQVLPIKIPFFNRHPSTFRMHHPSLAPLINSSYGIPKLQLIWVNSSKDSLIYKRIFVDVLYDAFNPSQMYHILYYVRSLAESHRYSWVAACSSQCEKKGRSRLMFHFDEKQVLQGEMVYLIGYLETSDGKCGFYSDICIINFPSK